MDSYIFILNMYLHSKLKNRSKPIKIGFIGCGKFVSMFLAQYNQLEKIQIDSIVDVDTEKAKKKTVEGQKYVSKNYSLEAICEKWKKIIINLI